MFSYFEGYALDLDETVKTLTAEAQRQRDEAIALRDDADRDLARAELAIERAESDYRAENLTAEQYRRLSERAETERDASAAEVEQRARKVTELDEHVRALDADSALAERLGSIKQAIRGRVADAEGIEAVRAALATVVERFTFYPEEKQTIGINLRAAERFPEYVLGLGIERKAAERVPLALTDIRVP